VLRFVGDDVMVLHVAGQASSIVDAAGLYAASDWFVTGCRSSGGGWGLNVGVGGGHLVPQASTGSNSTASGRCGASGHTSRRPRIGDTLWPHPMAAHALG
jgi:hypothetical protein